MSYYSHTHFSLVLVIPCYNEFGRLQTEVFHSFLQKKNNVAIVFSNDGSRDNTLEILHKIKAGAPNQVFINNLKTNSGKAAAVRSGFLFSEKHLRFSKIAYLDADLSTTLDECLKLSKLIDNKVLFVFGSRISKIDNIINRKLLRFFIGRLIATLISMQLKLSIYDSQCGCKVFRADLARQLFKERFLSKWLFDVELFHRLIQLIGKNSIKHTVKEIPLESWIDTSNSKVKISYFFTLWYDLILISKKYKTQTKTSWKAVLQSIL
ncbi:glycosyltransferase [Flavivirga abyssicola]|uniref:glycosyltransferase n=1 Tax=Flavivirga abyssicola TaxID=3063533 RepID=UPI0026DFFC0D|nr:glycosyltransferase [Flavivirga sp. MEBiC07777]WVK12747.1 glycosyltransferase [Flavivirga sp. MEBiC07777]